MTAVRKKLIEVALPLPEINDASAYDKMPGIGPHPKGIHQWWARLPLPTARAVLFASVVDDPGEQPDKWPDEAAQNGERERLFDIIRKMMRKKLHEAPEIYAEAQKEMLKHCAGKLPAVFDPFAGGGSIPLEANRMGFEAHAGDLNPVAVLMNKCNLELAPRWANRPPVNPEDHRRIGGAEAWRGSDGLAADIRHYGGMIGKRATKAIGRFYPKAHLTAKQGGGEVNVIAWIWVWTVASPNPAAQGGHVPIASSFLLTSKGEKSVWIEPIHDDQAQDGWRFEVRSGTPTKQQLSHARLGTKAGKGQDFICFLTTTPIQRSYIQAEGKAGRLKKRLMAIVADGPSGRIYLNPDPQHETICANIGSRKEITDARTTLLSGALPTRAEITGGVCTAYGLNTWGHLFADRQILALLTISDLISAIHADVAKDAAKVGLSAVEQNQYADAVITFLALASDRCADFNNALCRWSSSNQKVMNLFGKQALPMVFDFAEANFLGSSVGSWKTCSDYVADCVEVITAGSSKVGSARQLDAATEQNESDHILVSTDPPYYNNISYAVLSDFFYVWLRKSIGHLYPDIFGTLLVPKMPELIAAANRFDGNALTAKHHFETGFRNAFTALRNKMDPRFPLTVYYAFKQDDQDTGAEEASADKKTHTSTSVDRTTGWETMLEALVGTGFQITATWPVRASQKWRMVSMGTNALASYIVLACRPRPANAPQIDRRSFVAELKEELPPALRHLQQGNIAPVDLAQAAIGPGMAVYSRYASVIDAAGKSLSVREALTLINQTLDEVLAEQEGDFDADSRWALTWFEQSGFAEGEYGIAEQLSKSKNTSVAGMVEADILESKRGRVRLLRPTELQTDWDPATDLRLTVWEMVHQLVRALESDGEAATAALVAKLGSRAEIARELAYRLFTIADRKKRSAEARSYNGLVQSWPEIVRLAREKTAPTAPADLFA